MIFIIFNEGNYLQCGYSYSLKQKNAVGTLTSINLMPWAGRHPYLFLNALALDGINKYEKLTFEKIEEVSGVDYYKVTAIGNSASDIKIGIDSEGRLVYYAENEPAGTYYFIKELAIEYISNS